MSRSEKLYFAYLMYTHEYEFKKINITYRLRQRSEGAGAPKDLRAGLDIHSSSQMCWVGRLVALNDIKGHKGSMLSEEKELWGFGQVSLESLAQPSFKSHSSKSCQFIISTSTTQHHLPRT